MRNVLVVGVGNFGSWWVISLLRWSKSLRIDCFDVDQNKYTNLLSRKSEQIGWSVSSHEINCLCDEIDIKPVYDLVVIATSSDVRLKVVDFLVKRIDSKLWILEKVLAQSTTQLDEMKKLLSGKSVYVNHSRRIQPATQYLKTYLGGKPLPQKSILKGGKWELASNSFHFIDMFCFLYSTELKKIKSGRLNRWHSSSVREGFYDTSGEIIFSFKNGLEFVLDWTSGTDEAEWSFCFGDISVSYNELTGVIKENDLEIAKIPLINFSDLGALMDIKNIKLIQLPTFQESYRRSYLLLHLFEADWKCFDSSEDTLVPLG